MAWVLQEMKPECVTDRPKTGCEQAWGAGGLCCKGQKLLRASLTEIIEAD